MTLKPIKYIGLKKNVKAGSNVHTFLGSPQELVNPGVFVGVLQNMGLEEGGLCTRTGD
jgi:hypothetical protein